MHFGRKPTHELHLKVWIELAHEADNGPNRIDVTASRVEAKIDSWVVRRQTPSAP